MLAFSKNDSKCRFIKMNQFAKSDTLCYFLEMKITDDKNSIRLADYIEKKLRDGAITFTKADAIKVLGVSDAAFMRASQRLQKKELLLRPVNGFYVIIEVEFRDAGGPPAIHFVEKMMKFLGLSYYVGLLSAARYLGATHQAVFETQVFTTKPLRVIKYGKHRIRFITNKYTEKIPKQTLQTPHGDIFISTPEATLVDLVRYKGKAVGLSHVATVVMEMQESINSKRLLPLANLLNDIPLIQRVGFVLEFVGKHDTKPLQEWLKSKELHLVKLEPSKKNTGSINKKWQININSEIEVDDL